MNKTLQAPNDPLPGLRWPPLGALLLMTDRGFERPIFYGCLQVLPLDVPTGTDTYSVTLREETSGAVIFAAVYSSGTQIRLSQLRTDRAYRLSIEARAGGMPLASVQNTQLWLDPQREDFVLPLRF